ncbi:hypothetical protein ABI59_02445 [Acidobacteria bacterium Mor1]|nr:hypothetical protein ABI59_02445 [Acidobacteria bacterium Mor1]
MRPSTSAGTPRALLLALLLLLPLAGCGGCGDKGDEAPGSAGGDSIASAGESPEAGTPDNAAPAPMDEPEPEPALPDVTFVTDREDAAAPQPADPVPEEPAPPIEALSDQGSAQAPPDVNVKGDVDSLAGRVDASPDDVELRRELAFSLRAAGRHAEAVPHFERIAELQPELRSLFELGLAYSSASRFTEAEAAYLRLLELRPNHPKVLLNLANLAVKRGDNQAALGYYQRAIEADPTYLLAHYNLGEMLQGQGQAQQAYAVFLATLELRPRNAYEQRVYNDAVFRVASIALSFGDAEQAHSLLTQLLAAEPNHRFAYYTLGQALMQLGQEDQAQAAFERHQQLQAAAGS